MSQNEPKKIEVSKVSDVLPVLREDMPYKRRKDGTFAKGNKGGPGGPRVGGGRVSKLSIEYHDKQLDKVLKHAWGFIKLALDPHTPPSVWLEGFDERWKVIQYVINRAHGRPRQTVRIQADGFDVLESEQVDEMVAAYLTASARKVVDNECDKGDDNGTDSINQQQEATDMSGEDFYRS